MVGGKMIGDRCQIRTGSPDSPVCEGCENVHQTGQPGSAYGILPL